MLPYIALALGRWRSSTAEQRFCKPQVGGSIPLASSIRRSAGARGERTEPIFSNPGYFGDRRRAPRRQQDRRLLQRERELEAARLICQALSQHINVDELVENALRIALEVVDADAGSVLLADDKTQQLVFRYVIGEKAEQLRGTAIPWDLGVAGAVFKSGEPAIIGNVARDTRHFSGIDDTTGYN